MRLIISTPEEYEKKWKKQGLRPAPATNFSDAFSVLCAEITSWPEEQQLAWLVKSILRRCEREGLVPSVTEDGHLKLTGHGQRVDELDRTLLEYVVVYAPAIIEELRRRGEGEKR